MITVVQCSSMTAEAAGKIRVTSSLKIKEGNSKEIKVISSRIIKSIKYKSSNKKVATVSKGIVTGIKKGTCTIKVTIKYYLKMNSDKLKKKVFTTAVTVKKMKKQEGLPKSIGMEKD